jgi:hypothetical protein
MGDPDQKYKRSQRRKRNYVAKVLWQDRRFKPKTHEVRHYEDDDGQQEIQDYLSDDF